MRNRLIKLGRGTASTALTPHQIAAVRAERIEHFGDQELFLRTFENFRTVARSLTDLPLDLETIYRMSDDVPVMEAAMIEALASLRAEGVQL